MTFRPRVLPILAILLLGPPSAARASGPHLMPLDPEIVHAYHASGQPVPVMRTEARFAGRPGATVNRVQGPTALTSTTVRALVLLVRFTDDPPGGPTVRFRPTVWDSMLFGDVYVRGGIDTTSNRTLHNFYRDVSYGTVDVITLHLPSTLGWLSVPNAYAYYSEADGIHNNGLGPYPRNAQRLVMDAVLAADPYVDFSQYAADGVIRNLFVVHSGSGAEWNGGGQLIWSHAWDVRGSGIPALYVDGVQVGAYSMEPECGGNTTGGGTPLLPTVGVYAHEFGHVLGLPDEYDYGYESQGTGRVSLMAGGSWNRWPNVYPDCAGNSPARPSAWGLVQLGFVTPTEVTGPTTGITVPPVATTASGSVLKVAQPGSSSEYWLFENRQQTGFDEGLGRLGTAAHGLCIYHVDTSVLARTYWLPNEAECVSGSPRAYRGTRNCDCDTLAATAPNGERWYGISLEQADGLYQLEMGTSGGDAGDFWPGSTGAHAFTPNTVPNTTAYNRLLGCDGLVAATNIQEVGQDVTLDLTPDWTMALAVSDDRARAALALEPVRPSPSRGEARIGFTLARDAAVRVSVVDLQGRTLAVLATGTLSAGRHSLRWDGDTREGAAPAGLYFVRLEAEGRVTSQRLVRLR